jgi:hypothetical protein
VKPTKLPTDVLYNGAPTLRGALNILMKSLING